jgi:hypothetical protein
LQWPLQPELAGSSASAYELQSSKRYKIRRPASNLAKRQINFSTRAEKFNLRLRAVQWGSFPAAEVRCRPCLLAEACELHTGRERLSCESAIIQKLPRNLRAEPKQLCDFECGFAGMAIVNFVEKPPPAGALVGGYTAILLILRGGGYSNLSKRLLIVSPVLYQGTTQTVLASSREIVSFVVPGERLELTVRAGVITRLQLFSCSMETARMLCCCAPLRPGTLLLQRENDFG